MILSKAACDAFRMPAPETCRWVARKKHDVVTALQRGFVTERDVCDTYKLSAEELASWRARLEKFGRHALRTTKVQEYVVAA